LFVIPQRSGAICFCGWPRFAVVVSIVILSEAKDPETLRPIHASQTFQPNFSLHLHR
jgi:hypothetical protein